MFSIKYLLCVHGKLCCLLGCVQVYHCGLDGDSGLNIGRGWGTFILLFVPAQALPAFSVSTTWVEAVFTGSWFPHVLCKLTARWHFMQHASTLDRIWLWITSGWNKWSTEKAHRSWCVQARGLKHLRGGKSRKLKQVLHTAIMYVVTVNAAATKHWWE